MGKSRREESQGASACGQAAIRWLNSFEKASKWMGQWDIPQLLNDSGGIIKISEFLPPMVAEEALEIVQGVADNCWLPTAANEDYTHNNIEHSFVSTKTGHKSMDALLRVFTLLLPDQLNVFSAARYCADDHIAPHDDRAYTDIQLTDSNDVVLCSRDVTVVYYLTKGWKEEWGGALFDLETDTKYVPEFNSAIFFRVPRWHKVEAVTGDHTRYSIFGWFLQPGKMYELNAGNEGWKGMEKEEAKKKLNVEKKGTEDGDYEETVGGEAAEPPMCKLVQRIVAQAKKRKEQKTLTARRKTKPKM